MKANDQTQYVEAQEHLLRLSDTLNSITPLALMLRGYGVGAKSFSLSNVVVEHLYQAALVQARAVQTFSHEAAAIWIDPAPVTPMSAVVKVSQTQTALVKHLETSARDSMMRFEQVQASATDLLTADD